jgi:hypothetical protein
MKLISHMELKLPMCGRSFESTKKFNLWDTDFNCDTIVLVLMDKLANQLVMTRNRIHIIKKNEWLHYANFSMFVLFPLY